MRKFNVTVNGISYEVNVEEVGQSSENTQNNEERKNVAEAKPVKKTTSAEGTKVTSPMPGNVFKLIKKDGDTVKKGDVILVLEAMKMENDIVAPADGKLALSVEEGAQVSSGDVLAVIA
ncbi:MAG: biotin/lipoyl-containing protein [Bacillota bacterium]